MRTGKKQNNCEVLNPIQYLNITWDELAVNNYYSERKAGGDCRNIQQSLITAY